MNKFSKFIQLLMRYIKKPLSLVLLVLVPLLLFPGFVAAIQWKGSKSLTPNTLSTCSKQASNFFFLTPYAARTDSNPGGGTVKEVANDGFTAFGLTYKTGKSLKSEVNEWLNTELCLIQRLWPTRTAKNPLNPDYFGELGSKILAANPNELPYESQEIAGASDQQMDVWIHQIETTILEAINDPLLNSRIVAWYLGPEELRYWVPREKELLQRIYETVKKLDPLQRPAWMYNPQNSGVGNLVQMGPWVDALSMGIYPHISNNDHGRIQVRHALTQMTTANALLGFSVLGFTKRVLPVLEMFENEEFPYNDVDAARIPEFVRHDAYAAFANGANGILIFSMGFRQGFSNYSTYYDSWVLVAQQIINLGLREVFQHGQIQNSAIATVTSGENEIDFKLFDFDETYPSLSIRDWTLDGITYILVVNSSEGEVSFQLDNITPKVYRDVFTEELHNGTRGVLRLSLPPLGVIILKTQSTDHGITQILSR